MRKSKSRAGTRLLIILLLAAVIGCQNNASNPPAAEFSNAGKPTETWDVIYAGGSKIGHAHTTIQPVTKNDSGDELVRITSDQQLAVKRFGQVTRQSLTIVSLETTDGQVLGFDSNYTAGKESSITVGKYDEPSNSFQVSSRTKGKDVESKISWEKDCRGFFGIDQSLIAEPMQAGDPRSLKVFQPILNQVGKVKLKAAGLEETELLTGKQKLLRIDASIVIRAQVIKQTLWIDDAGNTLKSAMPGVGFVSYRTTKDIATSESGEPTFDLGEFSTVKIDHELKDAHHTKRLVYKASVKDGDLKDAFPSGLSQRVKMMDERTVEIVVTAVRPDDPAFLPGPGTKPTDDELRPNNLIQSDDARIQKMATSVLPDAANSWQLALRLEKLVNQKIENVNFSNAFATAAEVAETLEGDCTEHAVLLAALCRARRIPARVAMGLVYYHGKSGPGYAYHMWTEVWINDRWVPLDATLAHGGIGAAHIKMGHSSLKGASAYSAFLPVIRVIGQLELEIVQ